jgi:competence protein ComEA
MSFQSAKHASGSSNREAKGFLFLIFILITPFLLQYGYRYLFYTPQQPDLSTIQLLTDSCESTATDGPYTKYSKEGKSTEWEKPFTTKDTRRGKQQTVDLNTADSSVLEALPGIGPAFAKRIIKYRTLLGGYVKAEQLKEVYGMPEETYVKIKPLCTLSIAAVKKIPGDSLWLLPYKFYHPYLSKELKAAIVQKKKTPYDADVLRVLLKSSDERLEWYLVY